MINTRNLLFAIFAIAIDSLPFQGQPSGSDKYQPAPSQDNLSHGGEIHSGQATYYDLWDKPNAYVSCGFVQKDPYLAAIRPEFMKASCGKCILVESADTGKKIKVRVVDTCPTCDSKGDVDLSLKVLTDLKPSAQTDGKIKVKWSFVDCGGSGGGGATSSGGATATTTGGGTATATASGAQSTSSPPATPK